MAELESKVSQLPALPWEIVSAIVANLSESASTEDLVYAWTLCRSLSKQVKKEVEDTFCKLHLPKTTFRFNDSRPYSLGITKRRANT